MDRTPDTHPIALAPATEAVRRRLWLAEAARTALLGLTVPARWPTSTTW